MDLTAVDSLTASRLLAWDGEESEYRDGEQPATRLTVLWSADAEHGAQTPAGGRADLTAAWCRRADLADCAGDAREPSHGATLTRDPDGTPATWSVDSARAVGTVWELQLRRRQR